MIVKKNISVMLLLLIGIILINNKVQGQSLHERKSYPVPANSYLEKFYKDNGIDLKKLASQPVLQKSTAWNFKVGSKHNWTANDFNKEATYTVNSTCQKVGIHCYIFVEDSLWTNGRVNLNAVNSVQNAFDYSTPADPNKGIYQTDVETYGNPPDVDHDSLIVILILNIRDGYNGTGGYVAGYFDSSNEFGNNAAEIYYLDANPQDLNNASGLEDGMSTAAHEFQHMIEFNYHGLNYPYTTQETFFNEGCSVIAEYINGYPLYDQFYFNNETNHYLRDWRTGDNVNVLYDYSRAARFFLYLKEQFYDLDKNFFKRFVTSGSTSVTALDNSALSTFFPTRRFSNIVPDWFTANYLNDTTIDHKWGYKYPNLPRVASNIQLVPNVPMTTDKVYPLAAQYVTFINGQNLSFILSGLTNGNVFVRELNISPVPKSVVDGSTMGNVFTSPNAGTGSALNNNVTYIIYDANSAESGTTQSGYSYSSLGSTGNRPYQLMYDQTEPSAAQYGTLVGGDSIAVVFDGIAGAKLDSIRVALRQAGSLSGNIYQYSGSISPTPIGKKLTLSSITATSTIAKRPPSNYPVPWNNWVKVDLRSYNIDAANSFVVAFGMNGKYTGDQTGDNRIMLTYKPGTSAFHSYEKLQTSRNGASNNQWHDAVDVANNIVIVYLIRAYVSFPGITGVQQVVELTPSSYKLEQNYPNPFNPETAISYQLSTVSKVQIKVYDILGKEIATLVNGEKPAGKYQITWKGTDNYGNKVSSGVYFYRIITNNFVQTKKMILLK
jgi:hypothetical protein